MRCFSAEISGSTNGNITYGMHMFKSSVIPTTRLQEVFDVV